MRGHLAKRSKGSWSIVLDMGRDPTTGKQTAIEFPSHVHAPHSIETANDGSLWTTMCASGKMARYDIETKQFEVYSSAVAPRKRGNYPHTLRINPKDPEGLIWYTDAGSNSCFSLHPKTHFVKEYKLLRAGQAIGAGRGESRGITPYGLDYSPIDGMIWYSKLNANRIGRIDPKTDDGAIKEWNPQEIEFTFEGPEPEQLYILQTRDMITIKKKEHLNVFADTGELQESVLGKGIGVSGSALSGLAVFTEENIRRLRQEKPDTPLILIRQDTVPEDIREISMADGLLTARGGQTSHASVVATRLEKTCVVGCRDLQVFETREYALINGHRINAGDPIAIDGRSGLFLAGMHPIREEVHILPL